MTTTMKINAILPFDHIDQPAEFNTMDAVRDVGAAVERSGFAGGNVTDHPVPTGRWLDAGGHHAQDPFVMLSLFAAHTKTIRLKTSILVLPYRNPFITARAVATLDVFSGGRVSLGVGAGYLKGEYRALGVDFDRRNDIMDEYLKAMIAAWTADEFTFEGENFQALGNRILPRPLQRPHPPLMIGGNSKRAIRRAVELGDAWNPFLVAGAVTSTSRTAELSSIEDVVEAIAYMNAHCEKIGRATPPDVVLSGLVWPGEKWTPDSLLEKIGRFSEIGVSEAAVSLEGKTRAEWCDSAERFGATVLSKLPKA
jgi:probable F420-dependent oxidoreductase